MAFRIIFLLILFVHSLQSQHFTKGQVYDFQEGDVFQTEYSIGTSVQSAPIEYRTDSIARVHYKNADSMAFDSKITRFFRITPAGGYSVPETKILTIQIKNLSDTLFHDYPWCQPFQDTIYKEGTFCDVRISERKATSDNPYCRFTSRVIPGFGGPYTEQSSRDTTTNLYYYQNFRLVYALKDGNQCGNLISSSTNIQAENPATVFPNPFSNELHFSDLSTGTLVQVTNPAGRVIWSGIYEGMSLDTTTWSPGSYFIRLTNDRGSQRVITAVKSQ
jgi:hypothetical protein